MKKIMNSIEKLSPIFDKIAQNKYVASLMSGFTSSMYMMIFASIFTIITYVPNTWGFYWSEAVTAVLLKPYNFTMGFLGVFLAGTITKAFISELNKELKAVKINDIAAIFAAMTSYFIIAGDAVEGGISTSYLGASGIFCSIIIAFVTGNIYKFCLVHNVTIKLPDSVPPNLSESFKSVFSFGFSVLFFVIVDTVCRTAAGVNLTVVIQQIFQPIFNLGDSYPALIVMYMMTGLLTFVGIHGSSILFSAVGMIMLENLAANQALLAAGQHPNNVLTITAGLTASLGGSGASLMICFLFAFASKSKQNKAIGRAALIPVNCGVNEPLLYGAPLILNPYFLIPFVIIPPINICIYKFFVTTLGMNGELVMGALGVPALLGVPLSTGFQPISFLLVAILCVIDMILYFPFFKAYDNSCLAEESRAEAHMKEGNEIKSLSDKDVKKINKEQVKLLVICQAGGTSGLLANAVKKGGAEKGISIATKAMAVAQARDEAVLKEFDLVVLAPQAAAHYDKIKVTTDKLGIKLLATEGKQYINLGQNPDKALNYVLLELDMI